MTIKSVWNRLRLEGRTSVLKQGCFRAPTARQRSPPMHASSAMLLAEQILALLLHKLEYVLGQDTLGLCLAKLCMFVCNVKAKTLEGFCRACKLLLELRHMLLGFFSSEPPPS